jgi:pyridoxamine 5'-phosphate oxidase
LAFARRSVTIAAMADDAFSDLRIDYGDVGLRRADLPADPVTLFRQWLAEAVAAGVREPNAMALATCDHEGQPHCRIVLLKQLDDHGFGFYTNKLSHKGEHLRDNQRAAVTFWWGAPRTRQVRIEGLMQQLPEADAVAYFNSRPRQAQLCSAASPQSQVVKDRAELEGLVQLLANQVGDGAISKPPHWGGYALQPQRIEFWQGRDARLHDRFLFTRQQGGWQIDRLAP